MISRVITMLLCVTVLGVSCSKNEGEKDNVEQRTSVKHGVSLEELKTFADASVSIEHLRKATTVSWDKISEKFEVTKPLVLKQDQTSGTEYVSEIAEAIKRCAAGEQPGVNQQTIAKGLQHVAVLQIREELDQMLLTEKPGQDGYAERVAVLFEAVRPTFLRRDETVFNGTPTLIPAADSALKRLKQADGEMAVASAQKSFRNLINKAYALSVVYEVKGIEKYRDSDRSKCDKKLKEAEIFYRIIRPLVKQHDAKADEDVKQILNVSYDAMNADEVSQLLANGLQLSVAELTF